MTSASVATIFMCSLQQRNLDGHGPRVTSEDLGLRAYGFKLKGFKLEGLGLGI